MRKTLLVSAMTIGAMAFAQQKPIITKWQTSNDKDKEIAINNRGAASYTFEKMGNPSIKGSGLLSDEGKTYIALPEAGEYIVKITPTSATFALYMGQTQTAEAAELKELVQWGNHNWGTSVAGMFQNCVNMVITATDVPDFSTVQDMSNMFYNASSVVDIPNINQWNVSNVVEMFGMFNQATHFNADISAWDTRNVTKFHRMFKSAADFNQDISKWDTSKGVKFYEMFQDAVSFDQNIGNLDFRNANDIENILDNSGMSCEKYTQSLKGWATNPNTPSKLKTSAKGVKYGDAGKTYRDQLINEKTWTFDPKNSDIYDPTCSAGLSVRESKAVDFKIVNPVKDILKISSPIKIEKTEIYATSGQVVKVFFGNEANVSTLSKGIYILKIQTEKGVQSVKIIKD